MKMISRQLVADHLSTTYADPQALAAALPQQDLPPAISNWLARLRLLYGVPIHYLVADERLLPPESIRFFYLDDNWLDALLDGAFSIGRNLTADGETSSHRLDRAVQPRVVEQTNQVAAGLRANNLGVTPPQVNFQTVSGFVLRSGLVADYPGLGVYAYAPGVDPTAPDAPTLTLLRLERLGPKSDTLLCLIDGDVAQADIHEAPEALHYGIDQFDAQGARKVIRRFTKQGDAVTIDLHDTVELDLTAHQCLRSTAARTVKMTTLATLIATNQNPAIANIDAAEMGFEMTQGVGKVSFMKKTT